MPDDHSKLEPPLPIPNRTVKRHCADDSAATSVKVGYRQANIPKKPLTNLRGFFLAFSSSLITLYQHSSLILFPLLLLLHFFPSQQNISFTGYLLSLYYMNRGNAIYDEGRVVGVTLN